MEKNRIKEIFYATDDCKEIELDENDSLYKDLKEKERVFKGILNYNAFDAFYDYMRAYEKFSKEQASVYYERGFVRGAETILCITKK